MMEPLNGNKSDKEEGELSSDESDNEEESTTKSLQSIHSGDINPLKDFSTDYIRPETDNKDVPRRKKNNSWSMEIYNCSTLYKGHNSLRHYPSNFARHMSKEEEGNADNRKNLESLERKQETEEQLNSLEERSGKQSEDYPSGYDSLLDVVEILDNEKAKQNDDFLPPLLQKSYSVQEKYTELVGERHTELVGVKKIFRDNPTQALVKHVTYSNKCVDERRASEPDLREIIQNSRYQKTSMQNEQLTSGNISVADHRYHVHDEQPTLLFRRPNAAPQHSQYEQESILSSKQIVGDTRKHEIKNSKIDLRNDIADFPKTSFRQPIATPQHPQYGQESILSSKQIVGDTRKHEITNSVVNLTIKLSDFPEIDTSFYGRLYQQIITDFLASANCLQEPVNKNVSGVYFRELVQEDNIYRKLQSIRYDKSEQHQSKNGHEQRSSGVRVVTSQDPVKDNTYRAVSHFAGRDINSFFVNVLTSTQRTSNIQPINANITGQQSSLEHGYPGVEMQVASFSLTGQSRFVDNWEVCSTPYLSNNRDAYTNNSPLSLNQDQHYHRSNQKSTRKDLIKQAHNPHVRNHPHLVYSIDKNMRPVLKDLPENTSMPPSSSKQETSRYGAGHLSNRFTYTQNQQPKSRAMSSDGSSFYQPPTKKMKIASSQNIPTSLVDTTSSIEAISSENDDDSEEELRKKLLDDVEQKRRKSVLKDSSSNITSSAMSSRQNSASPESSEVIVVDAENNFLENQENKVQVLSTIPKTFREGDQDGVKSLSVSNERLGILKELQSLAIKLLTENSESESHESESESHESNSESHESDSESHESDSESHESESETHESESESHEPESKSREAESESHESDSECHESESESQESESKSREAESESQESDSECLESETESQESESQDKDEQESVKYSVPCDSWADQCSQKENDLSGSDLQTAGAYIIKIPEFTDTVDRSIKEENHSLTVTPLCFKESNLLESVSSLSPQKGLLENVALSVDSPLVSSPKPSTSTDSIPKADLARSQSEVQTKSGDIDLSFPVISSNSTNSKDTSSQRPLLSKNIQITKYVSQLKSPLLCMEDNSMKRILEKSESSSRSYQRLGSRDKNVSTNSLNRLQDMSSILEKDIHFWSRHIASSNTSSVYSNKIQGIKHKTSCTTNDNCEHSATKITKTQSLSHAEGTTSSVNITADHAVAGELSRLTNGAVQNSSVQNAVLSRTRDPSLKSYSNPFKYSRQIRHSNKPYTTSSTRMARNYMNLPVHPQVIVPFKTTSDSDNDSYEEGEMQTQKLKDSVKFLHGKGEHNSDRTHDICNSFVEIKSNEEAASQMLRQQDEELAYLQLFVQKEVNKLKKKAENDHNLMLLEKQKLVLLRSQIQTVKNCLCHTK